MTQAGPHDAPPGGPKEDVSTSSLTVAAGASLDTHTRTGHRSSLVTGILVAVGYVVLGALLIAVIAFVTNAFGFSAVLPAAILALVPLAIVLLTVRWIDRWEPEPRAALLFAVLWGAAGAVAIGIGLENLGQVLLNVTGVAHDQAEIIGSVIQAPLIEEGAKGIGILIVLWRLGPRFDGPVDGVVYGMTVAAGFAFTENILYFGEAMVQGGNVALGFTFFVRGILSPFAHALFTVCTGFAIGLASRRTHGVRVIGYAVLGWIPAALLHALWNASAVYATGLVWLASYLCVQVPIFVVALIAVTTLRRRERRLTASRLHEYAQAGWYTPGEVALVATAEGRATAMAWAARRGGDKPRLLRSFVRDSTRLALTRQRIVLGQGRERAQADEGELLKRVVEGRRALLS